jgi:molecular chaperone DnaK
MPLSVSRYHRLGGGDIDRAIVHEVLQPQLLDQNKLDKFSLSFEEKRQKVQSALLTVAEALKHNMCVVLPAKTGHLS